MALPFLLVVIYLSGFVVSWPSMYAVLKHRAMSEWAGYWDREDRLIGLSASLVWSLMWPIGWIYCLAAVL